MTEDNEKSALDRLRERRALKTQPVGDGISVERKLVVLVDDEAPNLEALKRVLRDQFDIETYLDGPSALRGIQERGCPDLVITDQRMAPLSGVQFLKAVNRMFPQAVSIILSGYTDRTDLVGAINEAQVFAYVTKPWDAEVLLSTIDRALKVSAVKKDQAAMSAELEQLGREMKELRGTLPAKGRAGGPRLSADEVTARLDRLTKTLSKYSS